MIPALSPASRNHRISDFMRQAIVAAAPAEKISVGAILHMFGVRGFAFLLLALSLLNIFIFMVPFISIVFGIPMVIFAVQIVMGLRAPVLPRLARQQTIPRDALVNGLEKAIFWVEKIERTIKPRFMFLSSPLLYRVHGCAALLMAVMVALPIPVVNVPPSIGLGLLAIGLLQRDGIFIVLGYVVGFWCLWLFQSIGHIAQLLTQ